MDGLRRSFSEVTSAQCPDKNLLGRYSFTAFEPAGGGLRPLRDPDAVELDEDDEG
jgi:hypothetical protein